MSVATGQRILQSLHRSLGKGFPIINQLRYAAAISHSTYKHWRPYCSGGQTTSSNILRCPRPDLNIPEVSFAEFLLPLFDEFKDLVAIRDLATGREYTYTKLKDMTIRVGSALSRQGLRKGDRVLISSANNPDYSVLLLACPAIGLEVSMVNPTFTCAELANVMKDVLPVAVITEPKLADTVKSAIRSDPEIEKAVKTLISLGECEGCLPFQKLLDDDGMSFPDNVDIVSTEDTMLMACSSGTTGLPKIVELTHHNMISNLIQYSDAVPYQKGTERILGVLPFFHVSGSVVHNYSTFVNGATLSLLPQFLPEPYLNAIEKQKITILQMVPPMAVFLSKYPGIEKYDFTNVQRILCAAAPIGIETVHRVSERLGVPFIQGYGLTEASPFLTFDTPPFKPGTVGQAVVNTELKVVNPETGELLPPDMEGEICGRGPQIMKGYLNNEKATSETIIDGWLHTGDVGYYDKDGYLLVTDRLKELIKYKGLQVAPAELEALLHTHPEVEDAAVVGIPDERAGEVPKAFVVAKNASNNVAEQICHFVSERAAPHKHLRGGVEFVSEIPKSPSGKILRKNLR